MNARPGTRSPYRRFVADGLGDRLEEQIVGERLGSDEFLSDRFGRQPDIEIPQAQLQPLPSPLEELFSNGDQTPIMTAYRRHGYTLRQIADHLGCHYSTISRKLRVEEAKLEASTLNA